ncbi:hypothetical protein RI367_006571 [Sorochytrium milnesiophthora]
MTSNDSLGAKATQWLSSVPWHSPTLWIMATATLAVGYQALSFSALNGPRNRPPGPKGNQLLEIRKYGATREVFQYYRKLVKQYGSMTSFKVGKAWVYVTADAAAAKQVLSDNELFIRDPLASAAAAETGPMLFLISGPLWKLHRKVSSPAFASVHLRSAFPAIRDLTNDLFARFDDVPVDKLSGWSDPFNAHILFTNTTLDIFGRAFFSYNFNALQRKAKRMEEASDGLVAGISKRLLIPRWLQWLLLHDKYTDDVEYIRGILMRAIQDKVQLLNEEGQLPLAERQKRDMDLLDQLLLATQRGDNPITHKDLSGAMIGFFIAGHETTANTLTFITRAMCDHPELAEEVRQEVLSVMGDDKELEFDKIAKLKYILQLECFVKEAQRFYTVVPRVMRCATRDTTLGGYQIRKGTSMHLSVEMLHMSPLYWKDPHVFRPSRFETDTIVPGSFLPFGDGAHKCIGERLALLELKYIAARLALTYRFKLVQRQSFKLVHTITVGYKEGMFVQCQRIKNH